MGKIYVSQLLIEGLQVYKKQHGHLNLTIWVSPKFFKRMSEEVIGVCGLSYQDGNRYRFYGLPVEIMEEDDGLQFALLKKEEKNGETKGNGNRTGKELNRADGP